MNPKIEKLEKEIDKTKNKIAEMQARLRDLEKQKTELENTDYVAIARSFHLTPQQLLPPARMAALPLRISLTATGS